MAAESQGFSANGTWKQAEEISELALEGPLGVGGVYVITSESVEIETGQGEQLGQDAAAARDRVIGFALPISSLRYWVLGVPDPASDADEELDTQGRLAALKQNGWPIAYANYEYERRSGFRSRTTRKCTLRVKACRHWSVWVNAGVTIVPRIGPHRPSSTCSCTSSAGAPTAITSCRRRFSSSTCATNSYSSRASDGRIVRTAGPAEVPASAISWCARPNPAGCTARWPWGHDSVEKRIPDRGRAGRRQLRCGDRAGGTERALGPGPPAERARAHRPALGADVPVFVHGHAAWAEGVGELLTPIELPGRRYVSSTRASP